MRRERVALFVGWIVAASAVGAQQRPIFDPDDFLAPNEHPRPVFMSHIIVGGVWNAVDDYRALHQNPTVAAITNSLYWQRFQFDYKHSQVHGEENDPAHAQVCRVCNPPVYFPMPPADNAAPAAPLPAPRDTVQFAFYRPVFNADATSSVMLRYRFSFSTRRVDTILTSFADGSEERRSGRERSFGLDADTYFHLRGHEMFGSLLVSRTSQHGAIKNRSQNELVYVSRPPGLILPKSIFVRATLAVGGVSGRGGTVLNVVNPAFEAFWRHETTGVSLHLIWSPQSVRNDAKGWETHNQIAFYAVRSLYVGIFR